MNFKNKLLVISSLLLFILPLNVLAYSKYIIPGGETVGIEVNSKGVLVVGFYKVDESYIAKEIGFEIGDKIIKINDTAINNINATYDKSNVYGNITSNETSGVFGNYNKSLPTDKALEVAAPKEGNAVIRTVIKDEKTEEFTINILKVEENSKTKNILFQITDNNLIEKTGGVVQ